MNRGKTRKRQSGTFDHWPETGAERVDAFRQIVAEGSLAKIDGSAIDLSSAHAVVSVYDALNDENKLKFSKLPAVTMALTAWKLVRRE